MEAILNQAADSAVIDRVLAGDTDAFRNLVVRYESPLFGFVGRILSSREDREDVVQEAFLNAFTRLRSFDARKGSFAAWIFRIARNLALNARKRRRPVTVAVLPEPMMGPQREPEVFVALDRALADLPLTRRTAFELAEMHGFTYEEVAMIEGIKVGTVRSRIARARASLKTALGTYREAQ